MVSRISIFVIIACIVISCIWVKPAAAAGNGFWVMLLWFLILAVAIGTSMMAFPSGPKGKSRSGKIVPVTMIIGIAIAIMGLAAAFLSGDKFDTVRAGIISLVPVLLSYPRRRDWDKAEL